MDLGALARALRRPIWKLDLQARVWTGRTGQVRVYADARGRVTRTRQPRSYGWIEVHDRGLSLEHLEFDDPRGELERALWAAALGVAAERSGRAREILEHERGLEVARDLVQERRWEALE